jgi:uncharacterized protein (DUF924 family)
MKTYSKLSQIFCGCLLQFLPFFSQAQMPPRPPAAPFRQQNEPAIPPAVIPPVPSRAAGNNNEPTYEENAPNTEDRISEILDFWFGYLPGPDYFPEQKMDVWFAATPEIERQIRYYFSQDVISAGLGEYNNWRETPRGRLALILLLDQIPRHIYRGTPQAFVLDRMAQILVLEGLQRGDDMYLYPIERAFFYLPLEHSEDLSMQNLSVASFQRLVAQTPWEIRPPMLDFLQYAMIHRDEIARFGRFPYRNAILGRESTPEEVLYLTQWRGGR